MWHTVTGGTIGAHIIRESGLSVCVWGPSIQSNPNCICQFPFLTVKVLHRYGQVSDSMFSPWNHMSMEHQPTFVSKEVDKVVESPFLLAKSDFQKQRWSRHTFTTLLILIWITRIVRVRTHSTCLIGGSQTVQHYRDSRTCCCVQCWPTHPIPVRLRVSLTSSMWLTMMIRRGLLRHWFRNRSKCHWLQSNRYVFRNRLKCHLLQSIILSLSLNTVNVFDYHFHLL